MKKYLMMGLAAIALASCSSDKDLFDQDKVDEITKNQVVEKYNQAFIKVFGPVAPNQDWGFGTTTRTRATWTDNHSCNWESILSFTVPSDAKDLTTATFTDDERNSGVNEAVYVIPKTFKGELNLGYKVKFKNSVIYNLGEVTNIKDVNMEGVITFYNVGTMTWSITSGQHTIINTGTFTLANDANIGTLYNGGHLEITDTDISNSVTINSKGDATITMPNGGDFKAAADIHGTLTSDKNVKIQNSNTQYICGIKVTGDLDLTQGKLESSYIEANHIKFDGDQLWLLPGGHVKANSIEIPNGGCYVYGEAGSNGLIEVGNIAFKNDNDFERTFSDNIYFKITGTINFTGATNGNVKDKRLYNDAEDYVSNNGDLNKRLNAGNATGSPACGQPWTVGTPETTEPEPETPPTTDDNWVFYARVFAEDLSASTGSDFDFNDVVFDVYNHKTENKAKIVLLAAGGIMNLTVSGTEVHAAFAEANPTLGITTGTMINTYANGSIDAPVCPEIPLNKKMSSMADVKAIVLAVEKPIDEIKNEWFTMDAETGKPAAKFAVQEQVKWVNERTEFQSVYTNFPAWVGDPTVRWW